MVKIEQNLLPASKRPGHSITPRYITIHETGNTSRGAGARAHGNFLQNNAPNPSWHYSVDDTVIVQSMLHSQGGWHAGDGSGPGNTQSIGIEICVNSDGSFEQAKKNAAWLTAKLLKELGLNIGAVKQHYDWSRKNCPARIRAERNGWSNFLGLVEAEMAGKPETPAPSKLPEVIRVIPVRLYDSDGKRLEDIEGLVGYLMRGERVFTTIELKCIEALPVGTYAVKGEGDWIRLTITADVRTAIKILRRSVGLE